MTLAPYSCLMRMHRCSSVSGSHRRRQASLRSSRSTWTGKRQGRRVLTYLWAADRGRHAPGPALVLEEALDVVPEVVEAREERDHGHWRYAGLARNLADPGRPPGEVGEGPVGHQQQVGLHRGRVHPARAHVGEGLALLHAHADGPVPRLHDDPPARLVGMAQLAHPNIEASYHGQN